MPVFSKFFQIGLAKTNKAGLCPFCERDCGTGLCPYISMRSVVLCVELTPQGT